MSLTGKIVRWNSKPPKIENYNRFLFVGPHPDDIELGAGATAAKLAAEGKEITFVICTDGRYGETNTSLRGEELIEARKQEAIRSAEKIGVKDVRFLEFSDGAFYNPQDLKRALAKVFHEVSPEVVFAPDPTVRSECHPDHLRVGTAVRELIPIASNHGIMTALGAAPVDIQAIAHYMTAGINEYIDTSGYLDHQLSSIFDVHVTQFPEGSEDAELIRKYLKIRAYGFGLRSGHRTAEGFYVLGKGQTHCLPEV